MAKTIEYEGYTIQSTPQHQTDSGQWQLRIVISFETHRGVRAREFSADGLYGTEQEADVHGITFGQRIIDGKVEGQSVTDLKTEDRRAMPRLRVQFRTTFADASKLEGSGTMLDLSRGGCRIESPVTVLPGFSMELRIHVPELEWPIMIDAARVQWGSGLMFGVAFSRLREAEQHRLEQLIKHLMEREPTAG